jgi:hypothetical protein
MDGTGLFVSSCSRRELARRRSNARVWRTRPQLTMTVVFVFAAIGAYVAGRGGI